MRPLPADLDVAIFGAGPAGAVAATILASKGLRVACLERATFPRYCIGESLLPRSNQLLEQAGLWQAVQARGYIEKRGAFFLRGNEKERFCFADGLPGEPPSTFQVPRDDFDQVLATAARDRGAHMLFGAVIDKVSFDAGSALVSAHLEEDASPLSLRARFVLDCSGFGRVLPRALGIERPAPLPDRAAVFSMIEGDSRPEGLLEGDIWICIDPGKTWIWIIPFSNGRTSVGAVGDPAVIDAAGQSDRERLVNLLSQEPNAARRLAHADIVLRTGRLQAWSTSSERLFGPGWALAGNTGEFLDPVFSSGVTLALESGTMAAHLVARELSGEPVDWARDYEDPTRRAVQVFKVFVEGWYRGDIPRIFFARTKVERVKRYITSILAGQVLNQQNPIVRNPEQGLARLLRAVERGDEAALAELA